MLRPFRAPVVRLGLQAGLLLVGGWPVTGAAQAPTIEESIVSCPAPCFEGILGAPGVTMVLYQIYIRNNSPLGPIQVEVKDDVPPGAVAFRVVDKGNGQPCPGGGGPTCANVPSPGGANGTGQVVVQNLVIGRSGSPADTVSVLMEFGFACPPVSPAEIVSNRAEITSIGLCAPCLTNAVAFVASCLPPPECGLLRQAVRAPDKTFPWVYTSDCGVGDLRLTGPDFMRPLPDDVDVEPIQPETYFALTLYQIDCDCAATIWLSRNGTVTPPAVHLKY